MNTNYYYNSCSDKSYVIKWTKRIKENKSALLFYDILSKLTDRVITARRQKCTRGLNCTDPKLHKCTKLHEVKIARRQKRTRAQNCTKGLKCTKTILHRGSKLHDCQFCTEGHNCTETILHKILLILNI